MVCSTGQTPPALCRSKCTPPVPSTSSRKSPVATSWRSIPETHSRSDGTTLRTPPSQGGVLAWLVASLFRTGAELVFVPLRWIRSPCTATLLLCPAPCRSSALSSLSAGMRRTRSAPGSIHFTATSRCVMRESIPPQAVPQASPLSASTREAVMLRPTHCLRCSPTPWRIFATSDRWFGSELAGIRGTASGIHRGSCPALVRPTD